MVDMVFTAWHKPDLLTPRLLVFAVPAPAVQLCRDVESAI